MRLLVACAAALLLTACGTMPFQPSEYPLRDGLIGAIDLKGTASVSNAQTATAPFIVYSYGGSKLSSNLKDITEVMVQQTQKELQKAAKSSSGGAKTMAIKVNSLVSKYKAFYWNSDILFSVRLGDGQELNFAVKHGSGVLAQDLNGCIAEGVMNLLNDPRVRAYLGS